MSDNRHEFEITGLAIDRVPPFLRAYCDCVDGVVLVPDAPGDNGSRWDLYRGGVLVGSIVANFDDCVYGSGPG